MGNSRTTESAQRKPAQRVFETALGAIIFWSVFAVSLYNCERFSWGVGVDQIEVFYGQIK